MNLARRKTKAEEAAGRRWFHLLMFAGVCVLGILVVSEAWTVQKLRNTNAILQQRLADLGPSENENNGLREENERLNDLKQAAMEAAGRLQAELQQLEDASNSKNAAIAFALQQNRRLEQQNQDLEARVAGRPHMPRVGAWLGVNIADTENGGGVLVKSVLYKSPAAQADVQEGDILEAIDGKLVPDAEAFKALMAQKSGGEITVLDLIRDNAPLRMEVMPMDWPQ